MSDVRQPRSVFRFEVQLSALLLPRYPKSTGLGEEDDVTSTEPRVGRVEVG
jgi:hypothetical protein